jgi:hypothetical protein
MASSDSGSFPQVLVEEVGDLPKGVLGFRRIDVAQILRVRLALEDLQRPRWRPGVTCDAVA